MDSQQVCFPIRCTGLGGALAFFNSPYTVTNAIIDNNRSYYNDTSVGGLYADANSPGRAINNTFANNLGRGVVNTTGISLTGVQTGSSPANKPPINSAMRSAAATWTRMAWPISSSARAATH